MVDKTTQARDAARTIKRDTQLRAPILRQYKVDAVNSDGTVDIETEAGVVPNVRRIATSALNAGDTVWCLRSGVDILIVDKVATQSDTIELDGYGVDPRLDSSQYQEDDDATNYPEGLSFMTRSGSDPEWSIAGGFVAVFTFRSGARNAQIAVGKTGNSAWLRNVADGENHVWSPWRKIALGDVNGNIDLEGRAWIETADEANGYKTIIRTNSNPDSGNPMFEVRSAGEAVRFSVDHDGETIVHDNLNVSGATDLQGNVTADSQTSAALTIPDGGGGYLQFWANGPSRQIIRSYDSSNVEVGRIDFDSGNNRLDIEHMNAGQTMRYRIEELRHYINGLFRVADNAIIDGGLDCRDDLTVDGNKNARLFPDKENDPTRALLFAASESNTPGILEVYCGEHEVDTSRELTLRQSDFDGFIDPVYLADYVKLGRNPRVRLDAAGPREDNAPHSPYAWAEWDPNDPRIEIRAPAGKYHVELRFIRNDPPVQGWQHEIEVPLEPEEEEEPDDV